MFAPAGGVAKASSAGEFPADAAAKKEAAGEVLQAQVVEAEMA